MLGAHHKGVQHMTTMHTRLFDRFCAMYFFYKKNRIVSIILFEHSKCQSVLYDCVLLGYSANEITVLTR